MPALPHEKFGSAHIYLPTSCCMFLQLVDSELPDFLRSAVQHSVVLAY